MSVNDIFTRTAATGLLMLAVCIVTFPEREEVSPRVYGVALWCTAVSATLLLVGALGALWTLP